ncbi:hypothetical protein [Paenibacillus alvei]|nr:hypothetical protein [Paenibacillus alvei]
MSHQNQFRVFFVPAGIMDVPDLTIYEQMAYVVLRSCIDPADPTAFPSDQTIAERGRMSSSAAIQAVKGLIQKGLLQKHANWHVIMSPK